MILAQSQEVSWCQVKRLLTRDQETRLSTFDRRPLRGTIRAVPANRRGVPRPERVEAIVDAARRRFEAHGYRSTSLGDIAKDLGLNAGAIHWYFPTKDDLFATVMRRIIDDGRATVAKELGEDAPPSEIIIRFLTVSEPYRGLHVDAHDRLAFSPAVAEIHDELHEWLDGLLLSIVRSRVDAAHETRLIAEIVHIVFEGLLGSTMERDRPFSELVHFLVDMLVATAPQAARAAQRRTTKRHKARVVKAGRNSKRRIST